MFIFAATAAAICCGCATTRPHADSNKQIAVAFYELAVNQHQPAKAARQYIGAQYIQHNPNAPDGAATFVKFFECYFARFPNVHAQMTQVLTDGNLVAIHAHWKRDEQDRGTAVVDIFRLDRGKIVEHWDVVQPVPEKAANSNTIF